MFKFEEICDLIRLVSSTGVASVEVEHAGSRVRIEGKTKVAVTEVMQPAISATSVPVVSAPPPVQAPAAAVSEAAPAGEAAADDEEDGLHFVTSPIVGTFYRAPNPDADPYIKVGDFVEKGQVLCIVEAMKLMNEIESDTSGTIVKVYSENAEPVEFGERLFAIKSA